MAIEAVLAEALKLPAAERAELAEQLLESVNGELDDPEHIAAWTAVIDRRVEEIRSGKAKFVDAFEALEEARQAAQRR